MNVKFALIPLFNRLHSTWGLGSGPVKFVAIADAVAVANVFLRIV